MRKSRWAVAAGLGSLALLLTACGSSSSPTAATTSAPQSSAAQSSAASSGSTSQSSTSSPATAPSSRTPTTSAPSSHAAQPQASSNIGDTIPLGTRVMIVQKTKLGYVLAEATGQVVYTYAHDPAGGTPTCTGSCASIWLPVTGVPQVASGEHIPGSFALVTRSDGTKQVTYNGHPLYTYKGASVFSTAGNGIEGAWYVVMLSAGDL
jgi:predicted lipoprotein with Yx(FWY)xxD motif